MVFRLPECEIGRKAKLRELLPFGVNPATARKPDRLWMPKADAGRSSRGHSVLRLSDGTAICTLKAGHFRPRKSLDSELTNTYTFFAGHVAI